MANFRKINLVNNSGSLGFFGSIKNLVSASGFTAEVTPTKQLLFKEKTPNDSDTSLFFLSSSNREPRIGIGFNTADKFSNTFEINSSKDSEFGTEISLKSSRTTSGGEIGDYAGKLNFVITSGSYNKVDTSGSIADIKAEVTNITEEGATGDIVLSAAPNPKLPPQEVLRIGGVNSNFSSSLRVMGSNLTVDYNLISDGNTQLNGNTIATLITASGDISSSGNVYGANLIGTLLTEVDNEGEEIYGVTYQRPNLLLAGEIINQVEVVNENFKFYDGNQTSELGQDLSSFNYPTTPTLHLTGSLIVTGSATIIGPLTITGSQLITDDITSDGTIRARVKSFDIPHPTRKGKRLVYGALEGPEHGIYCRGESKELKVLLPPEWRAMVDKKGITVQITPIGEWQPLYFKKLHSNWLYFGCSDEREEVHFYWEIKGERTDVPKLQTVQ